MSVRERKIMQNLKPWLNEEIAANGKSVQDNFSAWFGSSKVTNWDNEPLVVYHGAAKPFESFDVARVGSSHVDVEEGEAYFFSNDIKTAKWYAKDSAKQQKVKPAAGHVFEVYLSFQNPLIVEFGGSGIEGLGEEIANAKTKGHDGLICRDYDDGGISDHYIAFSPTQIKCAQANSGLYSKEDPRVGDGMEQPIAAVKRAIKARLVAQDQVSHVSIKP